MHGDFSRLTIDPQKQFSRVLMQQGRVLLDSDWNEQTAILMQYMKALATAIFGPYGGSGFKINEKDALKKENDEYFLEIGPGTYFVDGLLVENAHIREVSIPDFVDFVDFMNEGTNAISHKYYLLYLDVWEQHVNHIEEPSLLEPALGGVNTATRIKVNWQFRIDEEHFTNSQTCNAWEERVEKWQRSISRGALKAFTETASDATDDNHCIISPGSQYRGLENHLYRVEIHQGGLMQNVEGSVDDNSVDLATFKWSRDNGSVIFPIRSLSGKVLELDNLGQDASLTLNVNDWIEIIDDDVPTQNTPGQLVQIASVDRTNFTLELSQAIAQEYEPDSKKHPYVRRWDHQSKDGEIPVGAAINESYELEDGIKIQFVSEDPTENEFRIGDFWLIPARRSTGKIDWPLNEKLESRELKPHFTDHHYAPLAMFKVIEYENGEVKIKVTSNKDCRHSISSAISDAIKAHNQDKHSP